MIIHRLKLHNFGVYIGEHTFNLTPNNEIQPIVLIGALNGSGKTTFLNAIQFALYGKLAPFVVESGKSYDNFLRKIINRHVPQNVGASIELDFSVAIEGKTRQIRLVRTWFVAKNNRISESFDVSYLAGGTETCDKLLADSWFDFLEDILPKRIMPLFFFDGEKIEELADESSASKILATAINALLGMDIVEQLHQDLNVYARRKLNTIRNDTEREEYDTLDNEAKQIRMEINILEERESEVRESIAKLQKELDELRAKFTSAGGEIFESHSKLEEERKELLYQAHQHSENMETFVAKDETPFLLILPLLKKISTQVEEESYGKHSEIVLEILSQRDENLITLLKTLDITSTNHQAVAQFLDRSRKEFDVATEHPRYLNFSDRASQTLSILNSHLIRDRISEVDASLNENASLAAKLLHIERQLASVPDKHKIQPILDNLEQCNQSINELHQESTRLYDEKCRKEREYEKCSRQLNLFLEQKSLEEVRQREVSRSIEYASKARKTLLNFRNAVIAHHIAGIEKLIVTCFDELTRKSSLITNVSIDSSNFSIGLKSRKQEIKPKDLSAGERQLLAVAILWALSRYSSRPIPMIIDTPLGRLDSNHRSKLVNEYFPKASHQVILLSTDEEIYGEYHRDLQSSLSRSYLIEFDEDSGGSKISEGYFNK
ncbi:MAG: DNA sulfur modification protein DndD [Acidiferrobacterales bacterium]|nr:DNA sulfur modification protein DndD [Acidiferrobacterales bacterium]